METVRQGFEARLREEDEKYLNREGGGGGGGEEADPLKEWVR